MLMLPTLVAHPRVEARRRRRPAARSARAVRSATSAARRTRPSRRCATTRDVDAVYIATPHELHAAARRSPRPRAGKHVLVEKPMALTLAECTSMIDAAPRAGRTSSSATATASTLPVAAHARADRARRRYGAVRMITAINFTDFLYRPRRPEELDTAQGRRRGVQPGCAPGRHRAPAGRRARAQRARAHRRRWDASRPTEGAYAAQLTFEDGAFASLVYSGYAHFDSRRARRLDRRDRAPQGPRTLRRGARGVAAAACPREEEAALKFTRTLRHDRRTQAAPPVAHNHFGLVIASCDRADLRPMPTASWSTTTRARGSRRCRRPRCRARK